MATEELGSLLVRIGVKLDDFDKGLNQVSQKVDKAEGVLNKLGKAAIALGVVFAGAKIFGGFINDAAEAEAGVAQLNAVLKSTGGAAGLTADEITGMASELQKVTKFSDDQVLSGQNLLLTFTKIGRDIFPQATETMLDMSQALGQDMKSSAIQLGKALNDPITGVTALKRVGVSFTEAQMEQIKAMAEAGNVMGAQKLILRELTTEFGGAAKAAGDTFAGKMVRLKNQFGEISEAIGGALLPILSDFSSWLMEHMPQIQDIIGKALGFITRRIRESVIGWEMIGLSISTFVEKTGMAWNKLKEYAYKGVKAVLDVTEPLTRILPEKYKKIFGDMRNAASDKLEDVGENVAGLEAKIEENAAKMQDAMVRYGKVAEGIAKATEKPIAKFPRLADAIGNTLDKVSDKVKKTAEDTRTAFQRVMDYLGLQLDVVKAKFGLTQASMGATATEAQKLTAQLDFQKQELELVSARVVSLQAEYGKLKEAKKENTEEGLKLLTQLTNEETAQKNLENQIKATAKALENQTFAKFLRSGNANDVYLGALGTALEAAIGGAGAGWDTITNQDIADWAANTPSVTITGSGIPQLAGGTNFVPFDTMAFLHKGEAVVPKEYNQEGRGGITVIVNNSGPIVGRNGMEELADTISQRISRRYGLATGGTF